MSFNAKILAEYTAPKSWKLFREVSFEFDLNNDDVALCKLIGANIKDLGKGKAKIICKEGMWTDLASVPRAAWAFIAPWDVARAAIIHDHLYAVLRNYHNGKKCDKAKWKQARKLADDIFLKGMNASDPKVPSWKKYAAYYAVRCFGWGPASAKGQDKFGI